MIDEMMCLKDLLAKSADANVLREMIGSAAERLIKVEISALTGCGEKSAERLVQQCNSLAKLQTRTETALP